MEVFFGVISLSLDSKWAAIAWEEFKKEMLPKILEEAKTPGTYPTKINVARTGEGHFVQVGKTTAEATQFINSIVCHRCQVMNISTKADKSLLDQYIVIIVIIAPTKVAIIIGISGTKTKVIP